MDIDQLKLDNWDLPQPIIEKYESRGIKKLFPWQFECLSNERVVRENRSLVYSAPTSAGKTLVAEILVLKTVLERKKKAIFISPSVSAVREKMFHFQDLLSDRGIEVEGFTGKAVPPGGFQTVKIAIATIESANSLINRFLLEGGDDLKSIGVVIIDELHLLGDQNRGYILELLITKLRYITLKYEDIKIQLIGMSATLPNLSMLAAWLDAESYKTNFRPIPLNEQFKINSNIYNRELQIVRELPEMPEITDIENIIQLCIEGIEGGYSVLIFCTTKDCCEKLATLMTSQFLDIGHSNSQLSEILQTRLNRLAIFETMKQLASTPTGSNNKLELFVVYNAVAFHHEGLTTEERDIIEESFRAGSLKVLVATSTLSTGSVNLPAGRVIILSPCIANGEPLDTLSYQQMSGCAGRMGDTGESIIICKSSYEKAVAVDLIKASLKPIESCLKDSGPLMQSLLEAIASNIVQTPEDLDCYIKCTLINLQEEGEGSISNAAKEAVQFLVTNGFLLLEESENSKKWSATPLGKACLAASVPPKEGLFIFEELLEARKCIAVDTELHVVYLVTPYNAGSEIGQINWRNYLEIWSTLSEPEQRVAELVGVEERFLKSAIEGIVAPGKSLDIHKRFYTALALYNLVREIPLHNVCKKFECNPGILQSLQQSSSTYAGMVTSFCKELNWDCLELQVAQFQTRLQFGVRRDLMDLLRLPSLNGLQARSLYKEGITTVTKLALADELKVERVLYKTLAPFECEEEENEEHFEFARQNNMKTIFISGKGGLTTREAAALLLREARTPL